MKAIITSILLLISFVGFNQELDSTYIKQGYYVDCNVDSIEIRVLSENDSILFAGAGEGFIKIKRKNKVKKLRKADKKKLIDIVKNYQCSIIYIDLNGIYDDESDIKNKEETYYWYGCSVKK